MDKCFKGPAARNIVAVMMVDADGEKALDKVAKDSPIEKAVIAEIERRKSLNK